MASQIQQKQTMDLDLDPPELIDELPAYDANNLQEVTAKVKALIDERGFYGHTIAHIAAERGDVEIMALIIKLAPQLVHQKTKDGYSPLCAAAAKGHNAMIRLLLKENANINDMTITLQMTPLHYAVLNGQVETAEFLAKSGADLDARDAKGETAADLACSLVEICEKDQEKKEAQAYAKLVDKLTRVKRKSANNSEIDLPVNKKSRNDSGSN